MKQQKLLKYIDIVTNRKKQLQEQEQEERRIKYEERMKEEEAYRPHPYAWDIQLCENFISYLTHLLPNPKEQQESEVCNPNLIEEPDLHIFLLRNNESYQIFLKRIRKDTKRR